MTIYWLMFFVPATMALTLRSAKRNIFVLFGFVLTLVIGLRYQVGSDWGSYLWQVRYHGQQTIVQIFETGREPAYRMLNWIAYWAGLDVWFTNLVCALLFTAGLISFVRKLPEPFLALAVCIPYLVIVVGMGYTRQAAAIGLILLGMNHYFRGRVILFLGYLLLAAMFHRTSVMFMAIAIVPYIQRRPVSVILLLPIAYLFYQSIIADEQDQLVRTYVESSYATSSAGGMIRLLLNACFAATFLLFRRRFALEPLAALFWFWVSVVAIVLVPIGVSLPTAADRFGVFLLPIQPFVASYLPSLVQRNQAIFVRLFVLALFSLIMAVWLFMADHRFGWLPYNFWLLK